jgi:hypothetical protein
VRFKKRRNMNFVTPAEKIVNEQLSAEEITSAIGAAPPDKLLEIAALLTGDPHLAQRVASLAPGYEIPAEHVPALRDLAVKAHLCIDGLANARK